mgnify:CR=1 FL=1
MTTQNKFPKIQFFSSILFFVGFFVLFIFFLRIINANNKEIELANNLWQTETLKRNELEILHDSIGEISKEREELETHFAQSSDIVPFLDAIEDLALKTQNKAEITAVDILNDNTGLMVGMKTSGTFNNLYKFISLLENASYEIEIVSMKIHKEDSLATEEKEMKVPLWNLFLRVKLLSFIN